MLSPSPQPQAARPGNGGARPAAPAAPAPRAGTGPIDRDLVPIYELIAQDQLGQAKAALETLIARTPQSTKAKALLAYAKGRAAQLENRIDDARVELNEALLLDKDLQLAKTAFAELMSRRR